MGYALTGLGAVSAAQQEAAIAQANVTPFTSLPVSTVDKLPAQKLAILSLAAIRDRPQIEAQLSYLGQFQLAAATIAVEQASGGIAIDALKTVGIEMLMTIYSKIGALMPQVSAGLMSEIGSAAGDIVPLIGTALSTAISVEAAWQAASNDKAIRACQDSYDPHAAGTGYGGALMPTDLLTSKQVGNGYYSTVGQTLASIGENTSRETYSKAHYAAACKAGPSPSCPYIPHETRMILHGLSKAILKMRGDPKTDGGASLFPVYIDLLWSQFRLGLMNYDWAWDTFIHQVLPDFDHYSTGSAAPERVPGGCGKYEKRGYEEAKEVLRNWELTVHPIYLQDQQKAKEIRAAIAKAEQKLRAPKVKLGTSLLASIAKMGTTKTTSASMTSKPPATSTASKKAAAAKSGQVLLVLLGAVAIVGGMYAVKKGYHRDIRARIGR